MYTCGSNLSAWKAITLNLLETISYVSLWITFVVGLTIVWLASGIVGHSANDNIDDLMVQFSVIVRWLIGGLFFSLAALLFSAFIGSKAMAVGKLLIITSLAPAIFNIYAWKSVGFVIRGRRHPRVFWKAHESLPTNIRSWFVTYLSLFHRSVVSNIRIPAELNYHQILEEGRQRDWFVDKSKNFKTTFDDEPVSVDFHDKYSTLILEGQSACDATRRVATYWAVFVMAAVQFYLLVIGS